MWQSEKTNNGKIPGPIRYKREKLLELFGRNIKRISLNKNDLIHGKKKKKETRLILSVAQDASRINLERGSAKRKKRKQPKRVLTTL